MRTLTKILGMSIITLGMLAVAGTVAAAPADDLQPASVITYNEELVVNHTGRFDSVYIGKQDEGGVTFFNGTIVNSTTVSTDDDGAVGADPVGNPVTFGDDVRIDGKIWRTEEGGDNPLKIADTIMPAVNNTYDLGTSSFQFKDGYFAGTLNVGALSAGNVYTKTEVDALVTSGGHDHIGETWSGNVQGSITSSVLTLTNTGNGFGLLVATSGNYSAIAGATSGTSAAVNGTGTGTGAGVTGRSTSTGHGVYAKSDLGTSLYVDGKVVIAQVTGTGGLLIGESAVDITNANVTADSIIILSEGPTTSGNSNGGVRVNSITAGVGFNVHTMNDNAASAAIPFRYLIIN